MFNVLNYEGFSLADKLKATEDLKFTEKIIVDNKVSYEDKAIIKIVKILWAFLY